MHIYEKKIKEYQNKYKTLSTWLFSRSFLLSEVFHDILRFNGQHEIPNKKNQNAILGKIRKIYIYVCCDEFQI
jgi:hypothetical protein